MLELQIDMKQPNMDGMKVLKWHWTLLKIIYPVQIMTVGFLAVRGCLQKGNVKRIIMSFWFKRILVKDFHVSMIH
nr:hypothetical protein [uncultured Sellimonas sp.]